MYNLFLGIFSVVVCLFAGLGDRALMHGRSELPERAAIASLPAASIAADRRLQIMQIAAQEIGVQERTGNNDGERVEEYLRYTKLGKGYAWCAAFVCWCYGQAGQSDPRNPWSPALFPKGRRYGLAARAPAPADIFGIYSATAKRIDHVGMIRQLDGKYLISIEGNADNRVLSKRRLLSSVYTFADWLNQ